MAIKQPLSLISCHPANPKSGDLCVWNMHDPPHTVDRYAVNDLAEAKSLIRRLTQEQLADDSVGCNAFGLEIYDGPNDLEGVWEEWEDQDTGNDILAVMMNEEMEADMDAEARAQ